MIKELSSQRITLDERKKKKKDFTTQAACTKGIREHKYTTNLKDPPSK